MQPSDVLRNPGGPQRADAALALLYALAFVGFPFVSALPLLLGVSSRPVSVAYRIAVLGLAIFLIVRWFVVPRRIAAGWPLVCFALVWMLLTGRLVWDALLVQLPLDLEWGEFFAFALGVCLVPAIAMLEVPSSATLRMSLWLTHLLGVVALLAVSALGVMSLLQGRLLERLGTDVLNPASVGYLAATVLVTALATNALLRQNRNVIAFLARFAGVCGMAIAIAVALASVAKGAILAVIATLLVVALLGVGGRVAPARRIVRLIAVLVVGAAAVLVAIAIEDVTSLSTVSRVTGFLDDESTFERTKMIRGALEQFAAAPWFGDAAVELGSRTYPHNVFLEAAMTTGIVGLIAFALFVLAAARAAWALTRRGWGEAWLALLFGEYLIAAALSGSLFFLSGFWAVAVGVLAAQGSAESLTPSVRRSAAPSPAVP